MTTVFYRLSVRIVFLCAFLLGSFGDEVGGGGKIRFRVLRMGLEADPPENYHLTVKKLPKTGHFF